MTPITERPMLGLLAVTQPVLFGLRYFDFHGSLFDMLGPAFCLVGTITEGLENLINQEIGYRYLGKMTTNCHNYIHQFNSV